MYVTRVRIISAVIVIVTCLAWTVFCLVKPSKFREKALRNASVHPSPNDLQNVAIERRWIHSLLGAPTDIHTSGLTLTEYFDSLGIRLTFDENDRVVSVVCFGCFFCNFQNNQ